MRFFINRNIEVLVFVDSPFRVEYNGESSRVNVDHKLSYDNFFYVLRFIFSISGKHPFKH